MQEILCDGVPFHFVTLPISANIIPSGALDLWCAKSVGDNSDRTAKIYSFDGKCLQPVNT